LKKLKRTYNYLNYLFKLSFENKKLENRFQNEYLEDHSKQNKIALTIALIIFTLYIPISYIVVPNDFFKDLIIASTLIVLSSCVLFILIKNRFKNSKLLILSTYATLATSAPAVAFYLSNDSNQIYLMTYIIAMIGLFVMIGIPIISATLVSFISSGLFIVSLLFLDLKFELIIFDIFIIFSTLVFSISSGFMIEIIKRKNYLAKYNLEQLNKKCNLEHQKVLEQEKLLAKQAKIIAMNKMNLLKQMNEELNKKVEKQVEENRKKDRIMFQQSKLASMGEMINNIAHQWRQPLNEINSSVVALDFNLIQNKIKNENIENNLIAIEKQTAYMSNTIESFSNYFKPDKKEEEFLLSTAISNTLNVLKDNLKKHNIQVSTKIDNDKTIKGYLGEYIQVIIAIFNNAIDAFEEKQINNKYINITINNKIIVDDNAGGIPESIIDKIFDPYFTTKEPSRGTGIGLYMANIIIKESMNGSIEVERIKKGSRFIIKI